MGNIAGKIMLLSGGKRCFVAILAGVLSALSISPSDFFIASFVSFTLLVWLLDGISSVFGRGSSINGIGSSFFIGWLFGVGYFVAGMWWVKEVLVEHASVFLPSWIIVIFCLSIPLFLAIFHGIATSLASLFWFEGVGRICIIACSFGFSEWLRSFLLGGGTWNSIGYAMMPIPVMMQSIHWIGLFGMNALSVFCFASPALFGTRQDLKIGMGMSSLLLIAHITYGMWTLELDSGSAQNFEKNWPVVRIVQPGINPKSTEDYEKILERYLSLTAIPVSSGEKEPSIIIWASIHFPVDRPQLLQRISSVLKKGQILVIGLPQQEREILDGKEHYYKSVYGIDSKGNILTSISARHLVPFAEYLPFRNILKTLRFDLSQFPKDYSAFPHSSILELSGQMKLYPLIFSDALFHQEVNDDLKTVNAILNIADDLWFTSNMRGSYQDLRYASIQAVEIGLPLIRVTNNGISAFIDSKGRILSSLSISKGASIDIYFQPTVTSAINSEIRVRNFWIIEIILFVLAIIAL
ncbi:MAG: apolipoprotein N-acyltransferase [Candidatus Liberibacter ctenarytainae]|uniref:Apolipoprotein N-acyltransferase n=1 Tax=Candidatus Liberibacter ctenarytainae TaxID=2020335 RepID=A0A937AIT4_9HYPH|nr:apolipoprotein N-acyltransferase [Candidatus Liberibacter ctenarytainae]